MKSKVSLVSADSAAAAAHLDALGEVRDRRDVGEVVGAPRLALALERDPAPVRPEEHLRVIEEVHLRRRVSEPTRAEDRGRRNTAGEH